MTLISEKIVNRGLNNKMYLGDLEICSSAFKPLDHIPKCYSRYGDNISPPLNWMNAPGETKEFALICYDPDAPVTFGFTHWVLIWNTTKNYKY